VRRHSGAAQLEPQAAENITPRESSTKRGGQTREAPKAVLEVNNLVARGEEGPIVAGCPGLVEAGAHGLIEGSSSAVSARRSLELVRFKDWA
jgi:hypothetical protein